ncbi:hypothetical protein V1509DRAFT_251584 [Lipomyces kononenkoae]
MPAYSMSHNQQQEQIHSSEEEFEVDQDKNDRIMKYLHSLPTPPRSPEHRHVVIIDDQRQTDVAPASKVAHGRRHAKKKFANALQPSFSQDLLPIFRRHHRHPGRDEHSVSSPLNNPTIRHVPARRPSIHHYHSPSTPVRDQPRHSVHKANVTRGQGSSAGNPPYSSTKQKSEKQQTMMPMFPRHLNGLNIMVLSPASSSDEVNDSGDVVPSPEQIAPDPSEKTICTIRQCSETSSIYADSLHDNDLNGIPPDQSRFKQVWMRIVDDDPPAVTENGSMPPCIKRKMSSKSDDQAAGSRTGLIHDAVSAMRLDKKSRKMASPCNNKWSLTLPSPADVSKSGSETGSNGPHDMYKKTHDKFESFLRRTSRDYSYSSSKGSLQSLGINDIRNLDKAEVAARHKEYLQDLKREKRRSRHRNNNNNNWSSGGHENCTCCRLVDEFSRI